MKLFNQTLAAAVIALSVIAHAPRVEAKIFIKYGDQLEDSRVQTSIKEISAVLAATNPDIEQEEIERRFRDRVLNRGVRDGLVSPALVMIDMAIVSAHPNLAGLLAPSVARLFPGVGEKLTDLGLPTRQSYSPDNIRAQADKILGSRHGSSMDAVQVDSLRRQMRGLDPSGMAEVLFGPGSYMYDRATPGDDFGPTENEMRGASSGERSPIFGMTRQEIRSCMSSCAGPMVAGARKGAAAGHGMGGPIGAVVGAGVGVSSGPIGAIGMGALIVGGYKVGEALGEPAGAAFGGGKAAVQCVSGCVSETQKQKSQPAPAPKPDEGEPRETKTPPAPEPVITAGGGDGIRHGECKGLGCNAVRPSLDNDGNWSPPVPRGPGGFDDTRFVRPSSLVQSAVDRMRGL